MRHDRLGLDQCRVRAGGDGRIVLLTIGMSNSMQASSGLLRMAKLEKDLNARLTIVNGALGGMTASLIQDPDFGRSYDNGQYIKYWSYVEGSHHNDAVRGRL
jgi:hypothetical protein